MKDVEKQRHWERVYETKSEDQRSWTQAEPTTSLAFIRSFGLDTSARIIDIGGGDSHLVDQLLRLGFENITVLDISQKALDQAKFRLGDQADKIHWVQSDINDFRPEGKFDLWHDRATFHFLTTQKEVAGYLQIARRAVKGFMTIGTFSKKGPTKCSGLATRQYDAASLTAALSIGFEKLKCITEDHITPFNTVQNFLFCSFKRRPA